MPDEEIELVEEELRFLQDLVKEVKRKLLEVPEASDEHYQLLDNLINKLA